LETKNEYVLKDVFITYTDVVSPLGTDLRKVFENIILTKTGIRKDDHHGYLSAFTTNEQEKIFGRSFSAENPAASSMMMFLLKKFLGLNLVDLKNPRTLLIICSTKGDIEELPKYSSSPLLSLVQKVVKIYSPANTPMLISNACISGLHGLIHGQRLISSGLYDQVVVVGVDSASDFVKHGFSSLSAVSEDLCRPFDANRKGLNLGEGAAIALLKNEHGSDYAPQLRGGNISNDANHITGPSRDGSGLYKAIKALLDYAQPDIDSKNTFISPHGTATLYNDEMESLAFSKANLSGIPMIAYKGYLGHTLATSGLLEAVIGIETLRTGILPVSYGYTQAGTTQSVNLLKMGEGNRNGNQFTNFIKTGSGFGGCNAAILITN
jgi:3-oxoacyl-[acyl-carrier-protein] synthase I